VSHSETGFADMPVSQHVTTEDTLNGFLKIFINEKGS
jgi:hypothetical protein